MTPHLTQYAADVHRDDMAATARAWRLAHWAGVTRRRRRRRTRH